MRLLLIMLMGFNLVFGLEILAKSFEYNKTKRLAIFKKDVNATKQKDNILSDIMYLYTTPQKKIKKIIAIGHVRFIFNDKNDTYKGKSDKLTYLALKDTFIFEGHVYIKKIKANQDVTGDKVIINRKTSLVKVLSDDNKPIRFTLEDK